MKIELCENAQEIRKQFHERYVLSWDEFLKKKRKEYGFLRWHLYGFDASVLPHIYLWERVSSNIEPSFPEAISTLKSIDGCVIFMSDDETHCYPGELNFNNQKTKNFVANADAKELAELIEKEWFGSYELAEEVLYNPPPILPQDLYVFDKSMNWFILFTHEAETVDPTSRYCILHNISK